MESVAELAAVVQRVATWMKEQRTAQGVLLCPEHGIEHTGKNAGLVVLACELVRQGLAPAEDWLPVAEEQALRLAGRLEREGDSTCWTFRPGRHDPFNCSNNVIDGGACSDALADFLELAQDRLAPGVQSLLTRACVLHAQTYLRYAAFDKPIPAQQAWALTGVAQAWRRSGHEVLRYATVEGVTALQQVMHADGSFAYHGHPQEGVEAGEPHPGATDVSSFYQSRVSAFALFALERIGQDPAETRWREGFEAQLEFLAALYAPDGIKLAAIEAKPWYHGAEYEVASHPFDVFALARGARCFERPEWGALAWRAAEAWARHVTPAGQPQSHEPGQGRQRSYQCPTFWAGHSAWMARALPDLAWIEQQGWASQPAPLPKTVVRFFPQAQLARLENEAVIAWVRAARPGSNASHGSPRGAGLLQAFDRQTGARLVSFRGGDPMRTWDRAGDWTGRVGVLPRWRAGWRHARGELRFSWWLARNAFRRAGWMAAVVQPWRALRRGWCASSSTRVHSAWNLAPGWQPVEGGVLLRSCLAYRDGRCAPKTELERRIVVTDEGLHVHDRFLHGRANDWIFESSDTPGPWIWTSEP